MFKMFRMFNQMFKMFRMFNQMFRMFGMFEHWIYLVFIGLKCSKMISRASVGSIRCSIYDIQ